MSQPGQSTGFADAEGVLSAEKDLPEQEVRNGVTVYRPPYTALPGQLKWAQPSKRIASTVLSAMQRYQLSPDFIHAHFAMPSGGAAAVIQKKRKFLIF